MVWNRKTIYEIQTRVEPTVQPASTRLAEPVPSGSENVDLMNANIFCFTRHPHYTIEVRRVLSLKLERNLRLRYPPISVHNKTGAGLVFVEHHNTH